MHSTTDRFKKKKKLLNICKTFRPKLVSIEIKLKFIKNIIKKDCHMKAS